MSAKEEKFRFEKFDGEGFTDYNLIDPWGPRGRIRIDHGDGSMQFTPYVESGTLFVGPDEEEEVTYSRGIGTLWICPDDGPVYAEIMETSYKYFKQHSEVAAHSVIPQQESFELVHP